MQEQLPLRPAEFVKIRDGFIAFLKQPAGTPIELVIPQEVLAAMETAACGGRKRRRMLDFVRAGAIILAVIGVLLSIVIEPMIVGILLLLACGAAFVLAHNATKVRDELEIDQIEAAQDATIQRNLRALDDFRNLIASNELRCEERTPDGTVKPLSPKMLRVSCRSWRTFDP